MVVMKYCVLSLVEVFRELVQCFCDWSQVGVDVSTFKDEVLDVSYVCGK